MENTFNIIPEVCRDTVQNKFFITSNVDRGAEPKNEINPMYIGVGLLVCSIISLIILCRTKLPALNIKNKRTENVDVFEDVPEEIINTFDGNE